MIDERYLLTGIQEGNKEVFSLLFKAYYKDMVLFGGNFLSDKTACEDIVQSVFLKLWDDHSVLVIETSLKSYLLRAVRNACLDEIRHRSVVREYGERMSNRLLDDVDTENYVLYSDLQKHLHKALEQIPELYKEAFILNRFGGLKYREIAEKLEVSERTVEVRISKTLELLRVYLKDFLMALFLLALCLFST
jgi:RNA polymerase sigma-70 factor (ECF subfamily)